MTDLPISSTNLGSLYAKDMDEWIEDMIIKIKTSLIDGRGRRTAKLANKPETLKILTQDQQTH